VKLISLTLENIKSYTHETIRFFEGVNFISGVNGAGKTTIIEAIGFALFDASPFSSLRQFIREGEKSATITVVIEAADERLYRVVRRLRLPSGGSWAVYDEESGMELSELHGNQDVKSWLALNLGITRDLEPTLLFEDVVGISQGKFTAPFLERPGRRKEIFNTILQLEGYREAFEKTSGLDSLMEKSIYDKEKEKSGMLVRIEDLEECREQLKKNEGLSLTLGQELDALIKELDKLEQEISSQEKLKDELEKGQKDLQGLQIRLSGLHEQKGRLDSEIAQARQCQEAVDRAAPGYREYLSLQEQQKELETRRKERDALNLKSQELQNRVTLLQAEISGGKDSRSRQLTEGETELTELQKQGEKTSADRKETENRKKELEHRQAKLKELQILWLFLDQAGSRARQSMAVLETLGANYHQLQKDITALEQALLHFGETEKRALSAPGLEKEAESVRETLNRMQAQSAALEENRRSSRGGMCPFLQMPCKNIEGDLEEYFSKEILKITPQIKSLLLQKEEIEGRLEDAQKALEEYRLLQHYKTQLEKLKEQEAAARESILKEKTALLENLHPKNIEALADSLAASGAILAEAGIATDAAGEEVRKQLVGWADTYFSLYREMSGCSSPDSPGLKAEPLIEAAAQMKKHGEDWWNRCNTRINIILQEQNAGLASLDTRLAGLRERYRKVSENLGRLREDRSIQIKEEELQAKEGELRIVAERARLYESLEEEWDKNKERAASYEPDYLLYMQNLEGAGRLEKLCRELQLLRVKEQEHLQETEKLHESLRLLEIRYSFDLLAALKSRRDSMNQEKGEKKAELDFSLREADKYLRLVGEKERVREEIRLLDTAVEKERKARQLLRLVRQTLNQSGEKIAQVYRQYLGREADLIYQQVAKENVHLVWADDYEVKIVDSNDGRERERAFGQLSGGEKMTAALAVRLALLKHLSGLGVGFFDEPTANLDENRRINLARIIPEITRTFRQIFVISHDDTFDAITENVIMLKKEPGRGTRLVSGT